MTTEKSMKIRDWVKINSNVKQIAEELKISRPTLYKYMDKYDTGEYESIPENIIQFFKKIISEEDGSSTLLMLEKLEEDWTNYSQDVLDHQVAIEAAEISIKEMEDELNCYSDKLSDNDKKQINDMIARTRTNLIKYNGWLEESQKKVKKIEDQISYYNNIKKDSKNNSLYFLKSRCYFKDNKCMVVHTGAYGAERKVFYRLRLYVKINNKYALLGIFDTVAGMNYFMLDNLIFTEDMYYSITGYYGIDRKEFESGEYPKGIIEKCENDPFCNTGMCALRE